MSMNIFKKVWDPFLVGGLIGLLLSVAVGIWGKIIGFSFSFVSLASSILSLFGQSNLLLIQEKFVTQPFINYYVVLAVFTIMGSWIAVKLSKSKPNGIPSYWQKRFGDSAIKRNAGAFVGGVIMMVGAIFAGGCTSSHAISGGASLAVSAFMFMGGMFVSGIVTAFILYKGWK
jgi:uncharacterized protein